jgi:hypothetical protein
MNEHDLILLDSEQQEIEKWVEKDLEAINYTRCCTTLKDKEALNFNSWLLNNGYMPYRDDLFVGKDKQLHFEDKLMQIYNEEVMSL